MLWAADGEAITLPIDLMHGGEFVVPDAGSITMTLRSGDGTVLHQDAVEDTGLSTVRIEIAGSFNELPEGVDLDMRFVRLDWTVGEKPVSLQAVYRVTPAVFFAYGPKEIRDLLGATVEEFPDSCFDMLQAYLALKDNYPELGSYLKASNRGMVAAHKAVALQAALDTEPSWPMRFMTSETEDTASATRSKIDFQTLASSLRAQLQQQTALMAGTPSTTVTLPAMLAVSVPTDPITNA